VVAVFALITISVVQAREPIDAAVTRSFDSAATGLAPGGATLTPLACDKSSLNFYGCDAVVSMPGTPRVSYRLWLRDDGCWTATDKRTETPPPVPRELQGCLAN
jgi:hypothetical protein